jgi:predicted nucleotidyltransferase component of viral defense system
MMINPVYRAQVDLLLQVLPFVAEEQVFALKGGTAINFFIRNLPRMSVDIDLSYLPFDDRNTALKNIESSLRRIKKRIEESKQGIRVTSIPIAGNDAKLSCQLENTQIIIEVNTTIRGHLFEPRVMGVVDKVQTEFEWFAEINVVSSGELFGGKICAALDRQHPRDLFDIHYLLENEGLTDEIRMGFIGGILSHPRPINEILNPNFLDQHDAFDRQFSGMTLEPFSYENFEATRIRLIGEIKKVLTEKDKKFLISFKKGEPEWDLIDAPKLKDMPAINWKLLNIRKLIGSNVQKHNASLRALEKEIGI